MALPGHLLIDPGHHYWYKVPPGDNFKKKLSQFNQ